MKKKIVLLGIFILGILIFFSTTVNAGSISVSNANPTIGDTITVTVSFKKSNAATVTIDSPSNFSNNGDNIKVYYDQTGGDSPISSMSFSFTATAAGSGSFSAEITGLLDADENSLPDESASSRTVTVSAPVVNDEEDTPPYASEDDETEDEANTTVVSTPKPTPKPDNNPTPKPEEEEEEKEEDKPTETPAQKLALTSLKVNGYEISPKFSKDVKEYSLKITDVDVFNLEIEAVANKEDTNIVITGNEGIKFGENIISIKVKTNDDKENIEYKIKVNKELETYEKDLQEAKTEIENLNNTIKSKNTIITILAIVVVVLIIAIGLLIFKKNKRGKRAKRANSRVYDSYQN